MKNQRPNENRQRRNHVKYKSLSSRRLVTIFAGAEPGGFFKLAEGMLKGQMEKQFEENLEALKKALEG